MATKTVKRTIEEEVVTCDADGCDKPGSHIPFNINGKTFDLCESHKAQINKPARVTRGSKSTKSAADRADEVAAKAWLVSLGKRQSLRGQIKPADLQSWIDAGKPAVEAAA